MSSVAATYLCKVQVNDNAMVSTKMLYDASFRVRYDDIITLVAAILGRLGFVFAPPGPERAQWNVTRRGIAFLVLSSVVVR